ncbi:hypothetical protein HDU76_005486 [Blyttiomyces sp. JEL0837]|nr:hypothetical protein HDU76_005486 [Blyttiomyces sp. JEL0837]
MEATKSKFSPSDEELVQVESLEKEFRKALDECDLISDQITILTITTTLTSVGTLVTDFWGWLTNPTDQQQNSITASNNHPTYERLEQQVDSIIDANTKDLSKSAIGVETDVGGQTLNIAGSGGCETELVEDAASRGRETGKDGDVDDEFDDHGNIDLCKVGLVEAEGIRYRKGRIIGTGEEETVELHELPT